MRAGTFRLTTAEAGLSDEVIDGGGTRASADVPVSCSAIGSVSERTAGVNPLVMLPRTFSTSSGLAPGAIPVFRRPAATAS